MARSWWFLAAVAALCSGCTTTSLNEYTMGQIHTVEEFRVDTTLDCLATVAASPDTLPSFALLASGVTHVQDTASVNSITTWTRALKGFATESFSPSASRQPMGEWYVDPVASFSQLDALRAACRWALFGPDAAWSESPGLLLDPVADYSPLQPHFGVASRLQKLPPNWVHVGCKRDVPKCAAYKANCGDTWIWVMPEEKWCFSEFILILHDIATTNFDVAVVSQPLLVTITRSYTVPSPPANCSPAKQTDLQIAYVEYRVVKPEYRRFIDEKLAQAHDAGACVQISEEKWMEATYAYNGTRTASKAASQASGTPNAVISTTRSPQERMVPETRREAPPEVRIREAPPDVRIRGLPPEPPRAPG